jgi:hypothetical protein
MNKALTPSLAGTSTASRSSTSRRGDARKKLLRTIHLQALTTSVGLLDLAGKGQGVAHADWQTAVDTAVANVLKAPYFMYLAGSSSHKTSIDDPPLWAVNLHKLSALSKDAPSFLAVFRRVLKPVSRFCRSPAVVRDGKILRHGTLSDASTSYNVSCLERSRLFRFIDPLRGDLDVPQAGARVLNVRDHLEWPYTILFAPEAINNYRITPPADLRGHRSLNLAAGATKRDFFRFLDSRGMLHFASDEATLKSAVNGAFSLEKRPGHNRFVFDGVNGNAEWSMALVQRDFDRLCKAHPDLAALHDCGNKVMNIASPSDIADFPPGIACKSKSDYRNYYFQWNQLPEFLASQAFCNIPGEWVDRPETKVRPCLRLLAMGSWIAALLAHQGHWCILRRTLCRAPLIAKSLGTASSEHRADFASVCTLAAAADDNMVAWADVPVRMRAALARYLPSTSSVAGEHDLDELRVPVSALELEPMSDASLTNQGDIEIHTHLVGCQQKTRARVASTLRLNRTGSRRVYCCLAVVYQDDNDTFTYPPKRVCNPNEMREAFAVAGMHRLVTILGADHVGLLQNFSKLMFPARVLDATLGVDSEFLTQGLVRWAVAAGKRRATAQMIHEAIAPCYALICEDLTRSVLGDTTWAFLVRRPLLSNDDVVYDALDSPNRPDGFLWLTKPLRRELWRKAALLPLAETITRDLDTTLLTFDASGTNAHGNGGYGVAVKPGLTQEMATELITVIETGCGRLPMFPILPGGLVPVLRDAHPMHRIPAKAATDFLSFSWRHGNTTNWRSLRSGTFKLPPRIVMLAESFAGSLAFQHGARKVTKDVRSAADHDSAISDAPAPILIMGGDNQGASGSLNKGRSSARDLNAVCRVVAARALYYDVQAAQFWLPSKANPADGPSRWWEERAARQRPVSSATAWLCDVGETSGEASNPGPRKQPSAWHRFKGRKVPETLPAGAFSLVAAKVSDKTRRAYVKALDGFDAFYADTCQDHATYSDALTAFVQHVHDSGVAPKATVTNLLCCVAYVNPRLKANGTLAMAWKAWGGWGKIVKPVSWLPLPRLFNLLIALTLVLAGTDYDIDVAIACLVAHHTYARGSEIDGLRVQDVVLPRDPRSLAKKFLLVFGKTKSQRPQTVTIDGSFQQALLRLQMGRVRQRSPEAYADGSALLFDFGLVV